MIAGWRLRLRGASLGSSAEEAHEECLLSSVPSQAQRSVLWW